MQARGRAKRRKAYIKGRRAEALCVALLVLKGYRIVARGYRLPVGEIDILARRGNVLAAIEVKARQTLLGALEAVTLRQRRRIAQTTESFLSRHAEYKNLTVRFDVMVVLPWRSPRHITDAWRP